MDLNSKLRREVDWQKVEAFFFKAMLHGWVSGANAIDIPEFQGCKIFPYSEENYYLADCFYAVEGSSRSFGHTGISFRGIPIWGMIYSGYHNKEVIPFLKQILADTYRSQHFNGGRGSGIIEKDGFKYENQPNLTSFTLFKGIEILYGPIGQFKIRPPVGHYEYQGGSLIDL